MKKLLFALIAFVAISTVASAAPYKIDDAAVDNAIESAVEVSPVSFLSEVPAQLPAGMPASASVSAGKSPVGAILLTFFLADSAFIATIWVLVPGCGLSIPSLLEAFSVSSRSWISS